MFNNTWTTGLSSFQGFTDSLQKIRADLEQNIEASLHHDQRQRTATAQAGVIPTNPPQQGDAEAQSQADGASTSEPKAEAAVPPSDPSHAPARDVGPPESNAAVLNELEHVPDRPEPPEESATPAPDAQHQTEHSPAEEQDQRQPDSKQQQLHSEQPMANGHAEPAQEEQAAASEVADQTQSTPSQADALSAPDSQPVSNVPSDPPSLSPQEAPEAQAEAAEQEAPLENGTLPAAAEPEAIPTTEHPQASDEEADSSMQAPEAPQPAQDPPPEAQPPTAAAIDMPQETSAASQPMESQPQPADPQAESQADLQRLQQMLAAREAQLEAKAAEQARLQDVVTQLMERNEELAMRQARVSEGDMDTMRAEFQERLSAAERRAYALQKERDSAKRAAEKASSLQDTIRERDVTIQQFAREGEELSKKQLALESTAKKLRAQQKESDIIRKDLDTKLLMEQQKAEGALAAQRRAEADAAAAAKAHESTLASEKEHYSGLLQRARAAQAEAEKKAADAAKEGLHRKLADAEARVGSMLDTVEDLRAGLAQQQQEAGAREDAYSREVAELQQRCQEADARHEQLSAELPSATAPLLRQLEAMQRSAQQHAAAWAATEAALSQRVTDADAAAGAAGERERLAGERLQAANSRAASSMAALQAVQSEVTESARSCQSEYRLRMDAEARAQRLEHQLQQAQEVATQAAQQHQEALQAAEYAWEDRRKLLLAAQLAAELRATDAEERLAGQDGLGSPGSNGDPSREPSESREQLPPPPAMPAPGYRWVLQKEGEAPLQRQNSRSTWAGGTAGEVEHLRAELRQRGDQLGGLRAEIMGLEATRNDLAEELLEASRQVEAGRQHEQALQRMERFYQQLQGQLAVAVEMVGERDERVSELADQIADMREAYQQQTEELISQLLAAKSAPPSPAYIDT